MNSTQTQKQGKFRRFLRNNAALLLLIFCILAIAAVVLAVTLTRDNPVIPDNPVVTDPDDNPSKPGNDTPTTPKTEIVKVYFASPVNYTSVCLEYTDINTKPVIYDPTMKMYKAHMGLDLSAAEGAPVAAMYDGTVIDVSEKFDMGYSVTIDHGDNVLATYQSLGNVQVVEGQQVSKGETIGEVSASAIYEMAEGAHLHLEITKNGEYVNPMPYVNGEVYREVEVTVQAE